MQERCGLLRDAYLRTSLPKESEEGEAVLETRYRLSQSIQCLPQDDAMFLYVSNQSFGHIRPVQSEYWLLDLSNHVIDHTEWIHSKLRRNIVNIERHNSINTMDIIVQYKKMKCGSKIMFSPLTSCFINA